MFKSYQASILFLLTITLIGIGLVMVYSASAPSLALKGKSNTGAIEKFSQKLGLSKTATVAVKATPTPIPTPVLAMDRPAMHATLSGREVQGSELEAMQRSIEAGGVQDPLSQESLSALTNTSIHSTSGLFNQLFALIFGFALLWGLYYIPLDRYTERALGIALFFTVVLLILVYASEARNGAHRWLNLFGITLQPSELAKLVFGLWVAKYLTHATQYVARPESLPRSRFIKMLPGKRNTVVLSLFIFILLLISLEPDMGAAFSLACMFFAIVIAYGLHGFWIFGGAGVGGLLIFIGIHFVPYRAARFLAFLDMENPSILSTTGYQLNQSLIALGSGGMQGQGIGAGMQKYQYLTEVQNDFIFANIGEEFGFIGTVTVLVLFALFVTVGFLIAKGAKTDFARLTAVGITTMIGISAFIHIAVVIGLAPTKGLTLPFISYGGSSLVINLIAVAILLGIAKDNEEEKTHRTLQDKRRER